MKPPAAIRARKGGEAHTVRSLSVDQPLDVHVSTGPDTTSPSARVSAEGAPDPARRPGEAMRVSYFNGDQVAYMEMLRSLPPEKKCACGWAMRGDCFGSCYGDEARGGAPRREPSR